MLLAGRFRAVWGRFVPYLAPLAVSAVLGWIATRGILAQAGRPAMPLDDSFIHLQFARRFAEGHPFSFTTDGAVSSGATSFLWPLLLAPFHAIGFRELSLIYVVWIFGTLFHAAVAVEMGRLVRPIAGAGAAIAAQAMCLGFGAFAWFAWSGMETIGITWALLRTFRMASDFVDQEGRPGAGAALALGVMGGVSALFRPEGAIAALVAAAAILLRGSTLIERWPFHRLPHAAWPRTAAWVGRLTAIVPLAIAAVPPLLNLILVGHARSTTATVKWLVGNPYYPTERLIPKIEQHARMLVTELIGGGPYTAIFLPEGSNYVIYLGAACLVPLFFRRGMRWRAALLAVFVAASILPATYDTMLWNRVRYIWPFAPAWFALVALLGRTVADVFARLTERAEALAVLIPALFAGALLGKLSWSLTDLATSARAIDHQQVTLGIWARDNLPADARLGVNDTGAIAYMSERTTFDVVGLTTESEARYWVAGSGSRYEHYERMPREALPTHFIVYREWMACPPVLGRELFSATVLDQSILGGATKTVYAAEYGSLGRGSLPKGWLAQTLVDEVDVSDLESEAAHRYALGAADRNDNLVFTDYAEGAGSVADGGRAERIEDRFDLQVKETRALRLQARVMVEAPTRLIVSIDGAPVGALEATPYGFSEPSLVIGPRSPGPLHVTVRAEGDAPFAALHYWLLVDDAGDA